MVLFETPKKPVLLHHPQMMQSLHKNSGSIGVINFDHVFEPILTKIEILKNQNQIFV